MLIGFSRVATVARPTVLTWKSEGNQFAYQIASRYKKISDIPHDILDHMNSVFATARRADDMQRKVFEAIISTNTAVDEPLAPPIHILNPVDSELTPPFEFHYSNTIWHSDHVPRPDVENLQGCDCRGVCDEKVPCACLLRQQKYSGSDIGFIYGSDKRLRDHGYPIFECNAFCGCEEKCQNRVVQLGRQVEVNIQKTVKKGWGVFAGSKRIPANTFIGIYAGEILTDAEGEERGFKYNIFGRTYLFNLDFYHLKEEKPDWQIAYCIDAYHSGNFTRFLNHSCEPNCKINACYINEANLEKPLLTVFTIYDVEPKEELCFSYYGDPDDEDENFEDDQSDAVYVPCQCGATKCTGRMWR
ncbi:SET domain-containing protein [Abortiporus biennis]|nr:SET domain-containing protein [Abortiporus biennis]